MSTNESKIAARKRMVSIDIMAVICVVVIAFMFYYLNHLHPLCADDFWYSFVIGEGWNRVDCFSEVVRSQIAHWGCINGRVWAHGIVQSLLMFDKGYFNIANTLCYIAVCFLLGRLVFSDRNSLMKTAMVSLSFWLLMPHPGSSLLWLDGAVNYLWTSCIILIYLTLLFSKRNVCVICSIVFALPAGNAHEGISVGVLVFLLLLCFSKRRAVVFYVAVAVFAMGVLSNVLAPSSFKRVGVGTVEFDWQYFRICYYATRSFFAQYVFSLRDLGCLFGIVSYASCLVVHLLWAAQKKRLDYHSLYLLIAAGFNLLICISVRHMYPRAVYGFCILTYAASLMIFSELLYSVGTKKRCLPFLLCLLCALNAWEYSKALTAVSSWFSMMNRVKSEVLSGNKLVFETEDWLLHKDSRYVEPGGLYPCSVSNGNLCRLLGASELCVVSPKQYRHLTDNKNAIRELEQYQYTKLNDSGMYVLCDKTKPKKVMVYSREIQTDEKEIKLKHITSQVLPFEEKYLISWPIEYDEVDVKIMYSDGESKYITVSNMMQR